MKIKKIKNYKWDSIFIDTNEIKACYALALSYTPGHSNSYFKYLFSFKILNSYYSYYIRSQS